MGPMFLAPDKPGDRMDDELKGSREFADILDELWRLHCEKAKEHGESDDGGYFRNVRSVERAGIEPWQHSVAQCMENVSRLEGYCKMMREGGMPHDNNVENALLDNASYSLIALIFHRAMVTRHGASQ